MKVTHIESQNVTCIKLVSTSSALSPGPGHLLSLAKRAFLRTRPFTYAFGVLLFLGGTFYGQSTVGTIVGAATTRDGAFVPNVSVTVTNEGTRATRKVSTDRQGQYVISAINPGTYTVTATAPGFATFQSKGIVLDSHQTIRIDLPLKVGNVSTQVTVTGGAPVIVTQMPSITTTVTAKDLTDSSSNLHSTAGGGGGSGLIPYADLVPTGHQGNGAAFSMGGARAAQAYYNVDGITFNSPLGGNYNGTAVPPIDMIHQLQYNYVDNKAEFGQLLDITVITKGGSNEFHGDLFEDFSNQDFVAQNYFSTGQTNFTNNDFGASIGGPILRRKLFFQGAYAGQRDSAPDPVTINVPTPAFRSGDFSSLLSGATPVIVKNPYTGKPFPNNIVPPALLLSPQSQAAQKWQTMFYPNPNFGPSTGYVGNFRNTYPQDEYDNRFNVRFDAITSPSNSAFVSFGYNKNTPESVKSALSPTPPAYLVETVKTYWGVLSDTTVITPNLLNIAKVGGYYQNSTQGGALSGQPILDALGIQGFPLAPASAKGIPALSISGFTVPAQQAENDRVEQSIQLTDQLTYQRGHHTIKGGFEYWSQRGTMYFNPTFGSFTFSGKETGFAYADFLLGLPVTTRYTYSRPPEYGRQNYWIGFLQDDWRATPNLTLSYGIRYDYNTSPVDKYNVISSFNPATGAIVVPSLSLVQKYGTPGFPSTIPIQSAQEAGFPTRSLVNGFKYAIDPRFGFAYSVGKDTVLRGGYGIYNEDLTIEMLLYLYQAPFGGSITYTNSITKGIPAITLTNPVNAKLGSLGAVNMTPIDVNLRNPYSQQWNLTMEQNIGFDTGLRLSYFGLKSNDLVYGKNINQVHASTTPFSQANTPYPLYNTLTEEVNGGTQTYNALTAEVTHHMRKNLSFMAAVTWAKDLTTDTAHTGHIDGGPVLEDAYNLNQQRGNDQYTPRIQFVSNLIWSLPIGPGQLLLNENNLWTKLVGGWELSTAFFANTGEYLTPTFSGADPSNTNKTSGSAELVGSPTPIGKKSITNWFNPKAYAIPKSGTFSDTGYGTLEGPGTQQLNLALFKSFPLPRKSAIRISGSFTNVLNHPNFSTPAVTINLATAGHITSTERGLLGGPRAGQVSVRFTF